MTFYLPRRFVLAAVSTAVLALVLGLVLLSGSDGDGNLSALSAGGPTLATFPSTSFPARPDDAPTTTRWWPSTTVGPTTEAPTTATEPAELTEPAEPATATTRRRSTATAPPATSSAAPPANLAPSTTAPPAPTTIVVPAVTGSDGRMAASVVTAHNRERAARGLGPLQRSSCLDDIAADWAAHLASIGELVHNPTSPVETQACMLWSAVGENLGYDTTIDALVQAWMDSAVHKANILDPAFTQVGVGIARSPEGLVFVVVNFAG